MLSGKVLEKFTTLVLKTGVNLQKGQGLELICPTEKAEIAEAFTKKAYELGAKLVHVRWENQKIDRLNYLNAQVETLSVVPDWVKKQRDYLLKENFCYVAISAEDPSAFSDVDGNKLSEISAKRSIQLKKFSDAVMENGIRWCVVSVPTEDWAKQVFPNDKKALEKLSLAIEKTMRLEFDNPVLEWQKHIENMQRHADFLNNSNFEYLLFKNALGTNLKVGLSIDHKWLSAKEFAKDGIEFVANLPTEEVFTAPHRLKVEGRLVSALPLCHNGHIIDNFTIDFKKGKIVSFSAQKGYDVLRGLINTDNGTLRLGEVALIGKNSPIAQSNLLFYNTLFDENASCHLAIGKAYPTTVKNGNALSAKELKQRGVNDSVEHVDFMIGTQDLNIDGVTFDGKSVAIFRNGDWVI